MNFQIGQKVVCFTLESLDGSGVKIRELTIGKEYEIIHCAGEYIHIVSDLGVTATFRTARFEASLSPWKWISQLK
jgi:hypothetical protein